LDSLQIHHSPLLLLRIKTYDGVTLGQTLIACKQIKFLSFLNICVVQPQCLEMTNSNKFDFFWPYTGFEDKSSVQITPGLNPGNFQTYHVHPKTSTFHRYSLTLPNHRKKSFLVPRRAVLHPLEHCTILTSYIIVTQIYRTNSSCGRLTA
jgi:hypothetical protein